MSKTVKKVDVAYHWSRNYPAVTIPAYLSDTAGLCVGHTHRLRVNHKDKTQEIVKLATWDIIQYPNGRVVCQGFKTKTDALDVCTNEFAKFSWVCLFQADFEKNNDMKLVRKAIMEVRRDYL